MIPSKRDPRLPPLAFGDRTNRTFTGVAEFGDALVRAGYTVHDLAMPHGAVPLAAELAYISLPTVTLLAVSSTAHRVVTERAGRINLILGNTGRGTIAAGGTAVTYHQNAGVLTAEGRLAWQIDDCAGDLEVSFDRSVLAATARAMLGLDAAASLPGLDIDGIRPVPPRAGVVDGRTAFVGFALQALRYKSQPRLLAASGLDDQCLRHAVFLLMPQAFLAPRFTLVRPGAAGAEIDRLCEWMRAHLSSPITLTELERHSGLSARSLQLGFQKKHGTTPMEWLRQQRLLAARDLLITAAAGDSEITVAEVAKQTGFVSPQLLHRWYRAHFGETPGDTLRGRR